MFSYNHAQRAVAGCKYSCRKAAAPATKKVSSALDSILKASKALALPSVPIPAMGRWRIRTCEDLFWALSVVLVAWLLQQAIEASNQGQAHKAKFLATQPCQVQLSSPGPQERPQQHLQESGNDGSFQGQEAAAGAEPAAAASISSVAFIYVEAGCSSERSSDSAADAGQAQVAEQGDAADAQCHGSRQQAAAAKGKLQVCTADSNTHQQQEACAGLSSLPVAAAAAEVVQQQAAVLKLNWPQRTFTKLLGRCGGLGKVAVM
uniref:Uncharacterized protein n=1 Tax=Tetradesmus obliquus TaxID=3088 RepID=A0A383V633_TETOB|eukprot:jgi/Sobl393_1/9180/SZX60571.1